MVLGARSSCYRGPAASQESAGVGGGGVWMVGDGCFNWVVVSYTHTRSNTRDWNYQLWLNDDKTKVLINLKPFTYINAAYCNSKDRTSCWSWKMFAEWNVISGGGGCRDRVGGWICKRFCFFPPLLFFLSSILLLRLKKNIRSICGVYSRFP